MTAITRLGAVLALAAAAFAGGYLAGDREAALGAPASAEVPAPKPAYMIVIGDVHDREAFGAGYAAHLPALYERFGGRYLAIGSGVEVLEGERAFESYVVAEWPSKEDALAFWNSDDYAALRQARIDGGWGEFDVFLVEGLARPTQVSPMVAETPEE